MDLRSGTTNLNLPTLETRGRPKDRFLEAVQAAARGEFEILGELGRRPDGSIAYLARDVVEPRLVALRLVRTSGSKHQYTLDVLKELDSTVPAEGSGCTRCGTDPRGWGRFCHQCGADLSGVSTSGESKSPGQLLEAVQKVAQDRYRILGEMTRAEGGGVVYFARTRGSDQLVGLRLQKEGTNEYSLGVTGIMPALRDASAGSIPPDRPTERPDSSGPAHLGDPNATIPFGAGPAEVREPAKDRTRPGYRRMAVLVGGAFLLAAAIVVLAVLV
jgi:hypothetical protein